MVHMCSIDNRFKILSRTALSHLPPRSLISFDGKQNIRKTLSKTARAAVVAVLSLTRMATK